MVSRGRVVRSGLLFEGCYEIFQMRNPGVEGSTFRVGYVQSRQNQPELVLAPNFARPSALIQGLSEKLQKVIIVGHERD